MKQEDISDSRWFLMNKFDHIGGGGLETVQSKSFRLYSWVRAEQLWKCLRPLPCPGGGGAGEARALYRDLPF